MRYSGWLIGVALIVLLSSARPAQAGLILITHGDTITDVHALTPEAAAREGNGVNVGFKYSYFGVFWINLWTYGGEYCLYADNTYTPATPDEAAALAGMPAGSLSKPFFYTFPLGLLIIAGFFLYIVIAAGIHIVRQNARLKPAATLATTPGKTGGALAPGMKRFRVIGKQNGVDSHVVVEAASVVQACAMARQNGMAVARAEMLR